VSAEGISKSYEGKLIVPPVDILLTPKSRIGLLGANGSGKSTLIRLLIGEESPDSGEISRAEGLKVSYFEQNRESLDPELSVMRTICGRGDQVEVGGRRMHVRSYLDRFLFSGNMLDMAVGKLSGGEQSRLLLAILMLKEANLLVLDEPTNDLDITTLDLLQDVLQEFKGAVLLATHDRYFLDQVSTQILGFGKSETGEKTIEKFASLSQWEAWHERQAERAKRAVKAEAEAHRNAGPAAPAKKKLSFKEQRELGGMEETILGKEERLAALTKESAKPENAANASKLLALTQEMSALQAEIERLYARWQELLG
jgi:ATP-binding cassette subfamily F protein uup